MARFLDPKNDLAFKRVFGEHKHLCMSLLNSMLLLEKPIVEIEYNTGEIVAELPEVFRNSIVDVRCTDSLGRQFLVEMQMHWVESFFNRVYFNASKVYVKQLEKGQAFDVLKPVYALNFLNENFEHSPEKKDKYFHRYQMTNKEDTNECIEGIEIVVIELRKFKPQNIAEKKLHDLWLRFLTEINEATEEIPKELLENEELREAIGYVETGAYSRKELDAYDDVQLAIISVRSMISSSIKVGIKEGMEKGMEKGIKKGIKEGREKGREEGIKEGREKGKEESTNETVIRSHNAGIPIETIAIIANLTVDEVRHIINHHLKQ